MKLRRILNRARKLFAPDPDRFLRAVSGVIHVGANTGQERHLYARHGLAVLWIEPIPEVFATLCENLRGFDRQRALERLVTDRDDAEYPFHVSNNRGESSSILDLKQHKELWPNVAFAKTITLRSVTLTTLLANERIDPASYDALVMDTQGSELLVLQGAEAVLRNFKYIKTEVPDFESYAGCAQLHDIESFLTSRGFRELSRHPFATRAAGGNYYDVLYARRKT